MRLQGANKRSVEDAVPYVASIGKICFLNAPPRAALHIYYLLFFISYLLKQIFRQNDVAFRDLGPIEGAGQGLGRCRGGGGLQAAGKGQLADDLLGGVFLPQVLETLVAVAL